MCSRFTTDTETVGIVFDRLTRDVEVDAFRDLVQRLSVIYNELNPPAPTKE